MKNEKLWQLLLMLALIVIVSSFFTRQLTSSGTLYDYAQENPEIAFAENETETVTEENIVESETEIVGDSFEVTSTVASSVAEIGESQNKDNTSSEDVISTEDEPLCSYPTADDMASAHPERITYAEGFFYEPITLAIEARIRGISYPEDDTDIEVSLDDLSYVGVLYNDFDGNVAQGELICNNAIALDLVEIFEELYRNGYQFERIELIDEYGGDDTLSMENNNTSCFNYRIVDGSNHLSKHAYGLAIDINPFYNPYVVYNKDGSGETYISPKGSEVYADRSKDFPYKIDENDLCYKLFIEHGFTWGGNWNSSKDYQHFQKAEKIE